MDEIGQRDQRPEVTRVERVPGERRRGHLEHAHGGDEQRKRSDRNRRERHRHADEGDDRGRFDDSAEAGRVGRGFDREQTEASAGDRYQSGRDHRGLQSPPRRFEQDPPGQCRPAGDQHAGEEEKPEDDRTGRDPAPGGEGGNGPRRAGADRECEHTCDQVSVVRDDAPAGRVRAARKTRLQREDEGAVVSGQPVRTARRGPSGRARRPRDRLRPGGSRRRRAA